MTLLELGRCDQLKRWAMTGVIRGCVPDERYDPMGKYPGLTQQSGREMWKHYAQAELTHPGQADWRDAVQVLIDNEMFVGFGGRMDDLTVVGVVPPYSTELSDPAQLILHWRDDSEADEHLESKKRQVNLELVRSSMPTGEPNTANMLVVARRIRGVESDEVRDYVTSGDFPIFLAQATRKDATQPWQVSLTTETPVIGFFRTDPGKDHDWVFVPRHCSRVTIRAGGQLAIYAPNEGKQLFEKEPPSGIDGTYIPVYGGDRLYIDSLSGEPQVTFDNRAERRLAIWPERERVSY